jgi:hypothetical protein
VSKIFTNPNQLEEWVEASERIRDRFGADKALSYVIGEKFYKLVSLLHDARKIIRTIDEERKKPDFNPVRVTKYKDSEIVTDLDETYGDEKAKILEAEGLLIKFAFLINRAFSPDEIRKYFDSHPRLGINGHISTEEEHKFLVRHGAMEHSIETEVEDALIFGDMMKYFGINV